MVLCLFVLLFLSIYYNELQGFGAEAPKPWSMGQEPVPINSPQNQATTDPPILNHGPTVGALTPTAPKGFFHKFQKSNLVTKYLFLLRTYTIFCMSEAATISNASRILSCTHRPLKGPQNKDLLWGL